DQAVAEEDLAVGPADDGADPPPHQSLRRVLARRPAPEVLTDHQHRGALVRRLVDRMLGVLLARVLECVLAHTREGHLLEEASRVEEGSRDEGVGVDVVAGHGNAAAGDLTALGVGGGGGHPRISLTSATAPAMAAAATMAGLMRSVRPVGLPWRPMKFRLLE